MDWDLFRYLLSVHDHGSLRMAAKALGVNEATVRRRLSMLETELNSTLFIRTNRGLQFTECGQEILAAARQMACDADVLVRKAAGKDVRLSGIVHIGVRPGLAESWVVPAISKLHELKPGFQIVLVNDNGDDKLIADNRLDLTITTVRPMQPELLVRRMGSVKARLYASPKYIKQKGVPQEGTLKGHDLVILTTPGDVSARHTICGVSTDGACITFEAPEPSATLAAIQNGLGVGLVIPEWAQLCSDLIRIWPDREQAHPIWMVSHPDIARTPRIRTVIEFLADALQNTYSEVRPVPNFGPSGSVHANPANALKGFRRRATKAPARTHG